MAIVSRTVGLQRIAIALPFLAAGTIASSNVVVVGLAWSATVQLAIALAARVAPRKRGVAVLVTAAFWMGPAMWLWAGVKVLTGSALAASVVAGLGAFTAMLLWTTVTVAGHRKLEEGAPN